MTRELCIMACVFCRDPLFQKWAAMQMPVPIWQDGARCGDRDAKAFVLTVCEVSTRNDLDRDQAAAKRFHDLVRTPFLAWKDKQAALPT